ncbi:hypothetical protein [Spirobacillus cienkowskii]|jgi:hypothetical protein|uniref:Uncharacterized protein n=1 Tax=Spirobacillus cienkowskii TaxID=495820 RepID=A0A369KTW0_9BACT|nr:MAG: hypothetical protein DCC88_11595 [Spirobacillus cienkowskii]
MGDVIDFFSKKTIKDNKLQDNQTVTEAYKIPFDVQVQRNKANQERLRKEREQANKNVIKSYRIK